MSEHDRDGMLPMEHVSIAGGSIKRPSASYLLAMKVMACPTPLPGYAADVADIAFLCRKMGIRTIAEIEKHLGRF